MSEIKQIKLRKRTPVEMIGKIAEAVNQIETPTEQGLKQKGMVLLMLDLLSKEIQP